MLSKEYVGQVIDTQSKVITNVKISNNGIEIRNWFEAHQKKGNFKNCILHVHKRHLWKGKPIRIPKQKVIMSLNILLFLYLIYKVSSL